MSNMIRYSVYGIARHDDDICYVGWTDGDPGRDAKDVELRLARIFGRTAESESRDSTPDGLQGIEVFELERASTREDAIQATDFWRSYCRFLGLRLVPNLD